jgi:hypothetical protein
LKKEKLKTFILLSISLSIVVILSACNLSGQAISQTQTAIQNLAGTVVAMTMQANPTRTQIVGATPTNMVLTVAVSPLPTRIPPNTPVWSAYNYTCELAPGGGNMTMNLGWTDRSDSEEGYKIYRDGLVIATLAPDSKFYVDIAFVATGKALSYSVEAFNKDWLASTSTITTGCQ